MFNSSAGAFQQYHMLSLLSIITSSNMISKELHGSSKDAKDWVCEEVLLALILVQNKWLFNTKEYISKRIFVIEICYNQTQRILAIR